MKRIASATVLAVSCLAHAQPDDDKIEVARPAFSIFHELGYITQGTDAETNHFEKYVLQRSGVMLNLKAVRNDRLTLNATLGGIFWNPTYNENSSSESSLRYFAATAPRASLTYVYGDLEKPWLTLEAGMFPYKYSEHSRNLGEYMFRTTAYPSQVFNGGLTWVDMSRAQLTGLRVSHAIGDIFSHDAFVTFETDQLPYYDVNLTYMAKARFSDVLKVGAGVQFARALPIRPSVTNPDIVFNRYFTYNDTTYIDNPDYYQSRLNNKRTTAADSAHYLRGLELATRVRGLVQSGDPATDLSMREALDSIARSENVAAPYSYGHYDASSIKTVATFAFDPKPLFGGIPLLGDNDLTLYGEAALLGLKNYPLLYEKRLERTVAMIGFNLPTFRQLDVLAVELEWFGSRAPNSSAYSQQTIGKTEDGVPLFFPQPSIHADKLPELGYHPEDWEDDNIRWSVFARRQVVRGLSLDLQAASDNSRGWTYPAGRRYWSFFRSPSDWYWMLKLTANI